MLQKFGIGAIDSAFLIRKYGDDLDWFFEEIIRRERKERILKQLDLGDVISHTCLIGVIKKGSEIYNNWLREKRIQLEEIDKEKDATVFDRLQNASRTNTLFHKLKYAFDKGNNN